MDSNSKRKSITSKKFWIRIRIDIFKKFESKRNSNRHLKIEFESKLHFEFDILVLLLVGDFTGVAPDQ